MSLCFQMISVFTFVEEDSSRHSGTCPVWTVQVIYADCLLLRVTPSDFCNLEASQVHKSKCSWRGLKAVIQISCTPGVSQHHRLQIYGLWKTLSLHSQRTASREDRADSNSTPMSEGAFKAVVGFWYSPSVAFGDPGVACVPRSSALGWLPAEAAVLSRCVTVLTTCPVTKFGPEWLLASRKRPRSNSALTYHRRYLPFSPPHHIVRLPRPFILREWESEYINPTFDIFAQLWAVGLHPKFFFFSFLCKKIWIINQGQE